jgi:hypothetical protein
LCEQARNPNFNTSIVAKVKVTTIIQAMAPRRHCKNKATAITTTNGRMTAWSAKSVMNLIAWDKPGSQQR